MAFVDSVPSEEEGVMAVMRRYPDQGLPMSQLTEIIMRSGDCEFSSTERELIGAYVSGTNACTYCYNTHLAAAEAFGVEQGLLAGMLDDLECSPVDDKLKPVLRYARKLTETPSRMVQADADAIFDAGWSEDSFHFTVMICALFNFYNRVMDGYGVTNTADFRLTRGQALAEKGYGFVTDAMR
jgi:uncharacterized peroxidase-related enzyme